MRFIPTAIHGAADYVVGLSVMALPFVLDLHGAQRWFFLALGALAVFYSLLTDYELGIVRVLRVRFHLLLDAVFGLAMLTAPSLLDLPKAASAVSYAVGILALILTATTRTQAVGTAARH